MYKIYNSITRVFLLIVPMFLAYPVLSQPIIIDRTDMPVRQQSYRLSVGDSLLQLDPTLSGPAYNWDFSTLNAVAQRKDSFLSANDIPFTIRFFFPLSLTFPTDNSLVQYINTPDSLAGFALGEAFQVYELKSNVMLGRGIGTTVQGIPLALQNQPADTVYRFPMNYGDVDSASTEGVFEFPGVVYYQQKRKRINTVDGWGSIATPYGTFDVLRISTQISGSDSVRFDTLPGFNINIPSSTEYRWLAKGKGVPILQINTTTAGQTAIVSSVTYLDSPRNVLVLAIEDDAISTPIAVYPNPAADFAHISWPQSLGGSAMLSVYDLSGKSICQHTLWGKNEWQLPVSDFPEGMYLLRLESGGKVQVARLMVRRE
jgi:hypothetical protein